MESRLKLMLTGLACLSVANLSSFLHAQEAPWKAAIIPAESAAERKQYWVDWGGEISSYDLSQRRYGKLHDGDVVLVYVTEPFNTVKQVKEDQPRASEEPVVTVFKLNAARQFNTGIYRYSVMRSIFSPLGNGAELEPSEGMRALLPLKQTQSVQEWCGMTFDQFNLVDDGYRHQGFSYFESEGDVDRALPARLTEDGLWTLIRIAPGRLPTGSFSLLSGMFESRVSHQPIQEAKGEASGEDFQTPAGPRIRYTVKIPAQDRELAFVFEAAFPHKLESYRETRDGETWVSLERRQTIRSYYWSENQPGDEKLRRQLGLDY